MMQPRDQRNLLGAMRRTGVRQVHVLVPAEQRVDRTEQGDLTDFFDQCVVCFHDSITFIRLVQSAIAADLPIAPCDTLWRNPSNRISNPPRFARTSCNGSARPRVRAT